MGNLTVKESGEMVNFISPNVSNITSFKVHFSPRQEGSGDPSPENVREITGWNGVEGYISNVAQSYSSTSNTLTAAIDWTEDIGTIYGGYVDLISGELVETHYMEYLTETTDNLNAKYNSETKVFFRCLLTYTGDSTNYWINELQCNKLKSVKNAIWTSDEKFINTITTRYRQTNKVCMNMYKSVFNITDEDSLNDMRYKIDAYLQENPIQVSYKMETPITHQLTPQQLSTLKGQNNFWSNADYIEIEYELTETFDIQKAKRKIILNQPHVESASGDIVTFDTDMRGKLKECKVYFSPVQEGEGDPSPENVRNIVGWNGVSVGLPSEYQEVEYVESTGTQWIDTGVIGKPNIEVNAKFQLTDSTNIVNCGLIGSRESNGQTRFYIISFYNSKWHVGLPNDRVTSEYPINRNQIQEVIFEYTNGNYSLIVNNTKVHTGQSTIATTYPMYLFGVNNYGTVSRLSSFRLYSLIIQQDETLVRNFIPCYRKSDNEIGMYDTVSKQFFTNQGTGTFIKGDDVDRIHASIDWTDDVGTVYRGYVDLVSGELVQTHYLAEITTTGLTSQNTNYDTTEDSIHFVIKNSFPQMLSNNSNGKDRTYSSEVGILPVDCKVNYLKPDYIDNWRGTTNVNTIVRAYVPPNFSVRMARDLIGVTSEDSETIKAQKINNYLTEHPLQVYYKLETPIHYQLTPQQLTALRGTNNIYSNTNGQTEIKYWKH